MTFDLIMTNLHSQYREPRAFPPFGQSDHSIPRIRGKGGNLTKCIVKRDVRASRKAELGRYLSSMDWPLLFASLNTCEEGGHAFRQVIITGLDIIMPVKRVRFNTKDASWMILDLKSLILKR